MLKLVVPPPLLLPFDIYRYICCSMVVGRQHCGQAARKNAYCFHQRAQTDREAAAAADATAVKLPSARTGAAMQKRPRVPTSPFFSSTVDTSQRSHKGGIIITLHKTYSAPSYLRGAKWFIT